MKTVEEIVKEKEYFELTEKEKFLVGEVAQNETEFNELKHLLIESNSFFEGRKVYASNEMREHIMEKLYPPITTSVAWYQSLWVFLFPPQKSFYQYPAFQLATVLILFLGVFTLWDSPFKNQELAQNDISLKKEEIVEEPISIDENSLVPSAPENELNSEVEETSEVLSEEEPGMIGTVETIDLDLKDEFSSVVTNSNATSEAGNTKNYDLQLTDVDVENNKFIAEPAKAKEMAEESLEVVVLDDMIVSEDGSGKRLNKEMVSPARAEKKESKLALPTISTGSAELFREKSDLRYLNIIEIEDLKSLFFEVK